jgi:glycosyltransferase involved in cell wall biosynthesis
MKILFWCGDYHPNPGGAQSVTDDLACELLRLGHEVTVLTRLQPDSPASEMWHGYEILRFDFPVLYEKLLVDRRFVVRSPGILIRTCKLLDACDVVCIGLLDFSSLYLLLLRPFFRFRLALYLHGGDTRKLPARERSYRGLLKTALWAADVVIPVSQDLAREATAYLTSAARKMRVIANAIDTEGLQRVGPWRHSREYIAFVGRLVEEKDVDTLIQAFQFAASNISDIDLLICGSGQERKRLENLTGSLTGRIHFLGSLERERAQAVIKGALFVAVPSRTEGHPIVVIEALAAGKPIIGSRIPAVSRLVADGISGALFQPGDAHAMALLIEKYCNDRRALAQLAAGAKASELKGWAMNSLVRQHLEAFGTE